MPIAKGCAENLHAQCTARDGTCQRSTRTQRRSRQVIARSRTRQRRVKERARDPFAIEPRSALTRIEKALRMPGRVVASLGTGGKFLARATSNSRSSSSSIVCDAIRLRRFSCGFRRVRRFRVFFSFFLFSFLVHKPVHEHVYMNIIYTLGC